MGQHTAVLERFDADHSGRLDAEERAAARAWLRENRPQRGRFGGPGGGRGGPPGGDFDPRAEVDSSRAGAHVEPKAVTSYQDRELFDPDVVRTFFLDFDGDGWFDELTDFYHTDVTVPARVTVDGVRYEQVGAAFRGNTSFMMARGKRKSFDLTFDAADKQQNLHGVRNLDLLNCNSDDSFVREMLHGWLANQYFPSPRVALVRVVVNGEDLGVFAAVQQFDRDYLEDHYDTHKGARFKIPPDFSGRGGLMWLGEEPAAYQRSYQLKSKADDSAWQALVTLCDVLAHTPGDRLEAILPQHLDVDAALWFLAIDNAVADDDGYHTRGSDYLLYRDPSGRFHPIPRDNNEILPTERGPGGPGGPGGLGGPGGRRARGANLPFPPGAGPGGPGGRRGPGGPGEGAAESPLQDATREDRPLLHRLLEVPAWRERYLADLHELATGAMRVDVLAPRLEAWRTMLDAIVAADVYSPGGHEAFVRQFASDANGAPANGSLLAAVAQRTKLILDDQSMRGDWPVLDEPTTTTRREANGLQVLTVRARAHGASIAAVHLHVGAGRFGMFTTIDMHDDGKHGDGAANDGVYGAELPAAASGATTRYWLEAAATTGHVDCQPAGNGALPFEWVTPKSDSKR